MTPKPAMSGSRCGAANGRTWTRFSLVSLSSSSLSHPLPSCPGVCDGMTYEDIQVSMPGEFDLRKVDKLAYRYPR
jgi:hypothetical protein